MILTRPNFRGNMEEEWAIIPEFPNYQVSNLGRIYNRHVGKFVAISFTGDGYAKINLFGPDGKKYTRSVAKLVASAFVEPPNLEYSRFNADHVVFLDGNLRNLAADNLVWRPRWLAWSYREQMTTSQPRHYYNLRVVNMRTGIEYYNVVEAGMKLGLLFKLIWKSTYTHQAIFPYWDQFEIIGRNDV